MISADYFISQHGLVHACVLTDFTQTIANYYWYWQI